MWVYQEKATTAGQTSPGSPAGTQAAGTSLRFSDEAVRNAPPEKKASAPARQAPPRPAPGRVPARPQSYAPDKPAAPSQQAQEAKTASVRRRSGQASRDCLLLAAAYLFGTGLSGVMQSLCEARELDVLAYYLESWGALFTLRDAKSAAALFGAQYCSAMGAVTALLLLGLCAFGPVLIFLFTMLYGVGTGIVSLQLFLRQGLPQYLTSLFFWGLPAAAMAGCLCFFGASALQVSVRLQHTAFGRRNSVPVASSARLLLGQYILIGIVLLPVCAVAAALLYLAGSQ